MFRIQIACTGIDPAEGRQVAIDIEREFAEHRTWWNAPKCQFVEGRLLLVATNSVDCSAALLDEFSDCLCAYLQSDAQVQICDV